ncbi:MAG: ribosomal-processing cysteine protease Prp [Defluviitaleaceae bacterium]|nr:ribosomal-processing cysteine protease Prp [Defluviitaleaceae bacterium]
MINAKIFRDSEEGKIIGFSVENHGESFVCAAVSMLVINTINSIELLTEAKITYNADEDDGGFITFSLEDPSNRSDGIGILLNAMFIGLSSAKEEHPDELEIKEIFV